METTILLEHKEGKPTEVNATLSGWLNSAKLKLGEIPQEMNNPTRFGIKSAFEFHSQMLKYIEDDRAHWKQGGDEHYSQQVRALAGFTESLIRNKAEEVTGAEFLAGLGNIESANLVKDDKDGHEMKLPQLMREVFSLGELLCVLRTFKEVGGEAGDSLDKVSQRILDLKTKLGDFEKLSEYQGSGLDFGSDID